MKFTEIVKNAKVITVEKVVNTKGNRYFRKKLKKIKKSVDIC